MNPPLLRFTHHEAHRANEQWGFNCGPAAIAAVLELTIDELRPHLDDFEAKRYTNPTLMRRILAKLRAKVAVFQSVAEADLGRWNPWPHYGLVRVQWEGPWTAAGVPIAARYRHTHWVGVWGGLNPETRRIFDVNCVELGGWLPFAAWRDEVVPWLLRQCEPQASGAWHVTHAVEISPERP